MALNEVFDFFLEHKGCETSHSAFMDRSPLLVSLAGQPRIYTTFDNVYSPFLIHSTKKLEVGKRPQKMILEKNI